MENKSFKKTTDVVLVFPRTGSMDIKGILIEIPYSVLFVASYLVREGFSVKIIDQRIDKDWKETLQREVIGAKWVGISSMTGKQISYGLEIAKFVRGISNTKIVWGGIHPSIMPEQTVKNDLIDIVVVGEGEETAVDLLKKDLDDVKGIYFKRQGKIIRTGSRDFLDMDDIPIQPFHLLRMENYFVPFVGVKAMHLHTSRGCPYRCIFCYNRNFNKARWRYMSAEKVADVIEDAVRRFNLKGIVSAEDNFFVQFKRVEKIFKELDKRGIHIKWKANCRIDYLDRMSEEFLSFLKDHGLDTLDIGVESGSDKILKELKKDITSDQIYRVNKKLAKRNIILRYSFMMGIPNEDEKDRKKTMKMILKLTEQNRNALIGNVAIFSPFPGCQMFDDVVRMGYSPPTKLEDWANLDYTTTDMPFIDKKLARKLENISHMSRFVDGRSVKRYLVKRPFLWVLANIYSRIVRHRWKKEFFSFMPELEVFKFVFNKGWIK